MKRWLPHIVLVTVAFLAGSVLTGNNAIAQKIAALSGSGTPGRLARWTSNSGGLGNSGVSEDKNGNLTLGGSIKFPDGSVQTTASTDSHFQQMKFKLALGQEREIQLPKADCPVRVEVSIGNIVIARTGPFPYPEQAVAPMVLSNAFSVDSLTNMTSSSFAFSLSNSGYTRTGPCIVFANNEIECEFDVDATLGVKLVPPTPTGSIVVRTRSIALFGYTIIPRNDFDVCVNMWY